MLIIAVVIFCALLVAGGLALLIVKGLTEICQPNEVLVFSGTTRKVGGRRVGYRLVHGGRRMRVPLLERVERLDLTNMVIDLQVTGAYSRGGIPLDVQGVANVKIASEEPTIGNAIERFSGVPRHSIMKVAKETLEGNLRGVLATLTPEEVNQDRVKFAESLLHEADLDLRRVGLSLDMLKVQHVMDNVGYLDSIGRKQSAALQMRSRVAEAENKATAQVRSAENLREKEVARLEAHLAVVQADAQRRFTDAQTKRGMRIAEETASITVALAKAEAEVEMQKQRVGMVRHELVANCIRPAEADLRRAVEEAHGAAAKIIEDGRATAGSLRETAEAWKRVGPNARKIFVAQNLKSLVSRMMTTVSALPVDKITVIDQGLAQADGGLAAKAAVTSEQFKHLLGLDVPKIVNRIAGTEDELASA